MRVKVVARGGGAKPVTLMVAASVLREPEEAQELQNVQVVGMSALAIACGRPTLLGMNVISGGLID